MDELTPKKRGRPFGSKNLAPGENEARITEKAKARASRKVYWEDIFLREHEKDSTFVLALPTSRSQQRQGFQIFIDTQKDLKAVTKENLALIVAQVYRTEDDTLYANPLYRWGRTGCMVIPRWVQINPALVEAVAAAMLRVAGKKEVVEEFQERRAVDAGIVEGRAEDREIDELMKTVGRI